MAITDPQFAAWLLQSGVAHCVLFEVDVYSGGSVVTRYLSTHGFVSAPADSPAGIAYDEILLDVPHYKCAMSEQLQGFSSPAVGEIIIDNSNGVRDSWLLDAWDGRAFRLYLGDPNWPKSDYRLMVAGVVDDIFSPSSRTLGLRTKDRQYLLTKNVCTNLVAGSTVNKDQRLPICYGEVFNIEPVLIDATTFTYAVHDGQINSVVAVYENGAAKTFTPNLAAGTFALSSAAQGQITADVQGSKTGGTYINKTADIVQRMLTERTLIPIGQIDSTSIANFNTVVAGSVGVYVKDSSTTVLQALDMLIIGAGGFYSFDQSGLFYLDQFKAPAGSPVVALLAEDIAQNNSQDTIAILKRWLPSKTVRLAYKKQWLAQNSGLAASVADARRAELLQGYSIAKATNSVPQYLLADEPPVEATLFVNLTDASTEAARRAALFSTVRLLAKITCFLGPARVKLGDVVSLDVGRYGLTGGAVARVVGINESLTDTRVELTLFL